MPPFAQSSAARAAECEVNFAQTGLTAAVLHAMAEEFPFTFWPQGIAETKNMLATQEAGRRMGKFLRKCPNLEKADFNGTGFTGTAIQAMIEELSQELALKEANFGGYPGNPELLATEAPPPAARAGGPGCGAAPLRARWIPRGH